MAATSSSSSTTTTSSSSKPLGIRWWGGGGSAPTATGESTMETSTSSSGVVTNAATAGTSNSSIPNSSIPNSNNGSNLNGFQRFVQSVQTSVQSKQEEIRAAKEAKEVGKIYDKKTQTWAFYFLDQELDQAEKLWTEVNGGQQDSSSTHSSTTGHSDSSEPERKVADREYYDLLGVSTSVDEAAIRKAYFKQARLCHPDKNPNDPTAHAKFQQLGHAYQVLSNPDLRAAYDRDGPSDATNAATAGMDAVDPFVFFNVMFGSALVEPYIGELWIASTSDAIMKDAGSTDGGILAGMQVDPDSGEQQLSEEERKKIHERMDRIHQKDELKQRIRQIKCAQNLRQRVAEYAPGKEEQFQQSAREEAVRIVNGAYGALYLTTIGFALEVAAEEYLGFENSFLGLGGHVARTKKSMSAIGSNFKLLGAGLRAAGAGSRAMSQAEKLQQQKQQLQQQQLEDAGGKLDEKAAEDMAKTLDESLPAFLGLAWAINKRDIQNTLQLSCRKLFDDASVPKEDRVSRAEAVRALGREFLFVAKAFKSKAKENFTADDIKARVAVAAMTTMAKAQGQEVTDQDTEDLIQQAKQMAKEHQGSWSAEAATTESTTTEGMKSDNDLINQKAKEGSLP